MKQIPLTRGQFALVDDSDFEWLNQYKWIAHLGSFGKFYVLRRPGPRGNRETIRMHRLICGATEGEQVDHKNGDTLDNRRSNLRSCSAAQNGWNRCVQRNNTSGFKGVTWHKRISMWQARIRIFSRRVHLGYFLTASAAGQAYKIAARKYHGKFARA